MKKILICIMLLVLVGCGAKTLVLNDVYNNINNLKYNDEIIFNDHVNLNQTDLLNLYGFDRSEIGEFLFVMPKGISNPYMCIIIKPISGKTDIVKEEMNKFLAKYDNSWGVGEGAIPYFPEAVNLINNRLERTYGDYLIYIISPDNELVYKEITK